MLAARVKPHWSSMVRNYSLPTFGPRWLRPVVPVVALAAVVVGCVDPPPEVTSGDPILVEGREIYGRSCASCHGSAGEGGVGAKLDDGLVVGQFPEIGDQIDLVTDGKNNMPAFDDRLTPEEIEAVVRYTREVL